MLADLIYNTNVQRLWSSRVSTLLRHRVTAC